MYESFFGLKEKPFNLTPDPAFVYMSQAHKNAYAHLEYAIRENKGFVVITGEIGSGKTTLMHFLFRSIQPDIRIAFINNTDVLPLPLLKMICQDFELQVDGMDGTQLVERLHHFLLDQFAHRRRVILVIDEAQNLPPRTLEAIRMISNLQSQKHHLLQMILIGQPELKTKLQRKDMKQFAQRVSVYYHLNGLKREELPEYIRHRLRVAGAVNAELFDEEAIEAVHESSSGIPRMVNILCDTALVYGFADEVKTIGRKVIEDVVEARKGLAISTAETQEETRAISLQSVARSLLQMDKRVRSVEKGMSVLEIRLSHLEERLKDSSKDSAKQYRIVLELLHIIRKNLLGQTPLPSFRKKISQLIDTNRSIKKA